jgi:alpha/beta superfamily hydrolase
MSKHPVAEKLFIDGPVGRLEALLERPGEGSLEGCAVVCHPHPQHGGTMHNKVAHTLARAFVRSGYEVLRFNFRGTENTRSGSQGFLLGRRLR